MKNNPKINNVNEISIIPSGGIIFLIGVMNGAISSSKIELRADVPFSTQLSIALMMSIQNISFPKMASGVNKMAKIMYFEANGIIAITLVNDQIVVVGFIDEIY